MPSLDKTLITFGAATLLGYLILILLQPNRAVQALGLTADMFTTSTPWIIVSMFAAGLLAQLVDPAAVARLLGREAGIRGILIAAGIGLFGTGSRWTAYPFAAGLLAAEASPGAVFAFLTTWQLISLPRLPAEVPFLGMNFTLLRAFMSLSVALLGGVWIDWFWRHG